MRKASGGPRLRLGGAVVAAAALCAALAPAPARAVVSQPQPRESATMVADPATGKLVLFGGRVREPNTVGIVNDTWTWSGTAWKRLSPANSPRPRAEAAMAADPVTGTSVLFGGDVVLSSQTTQGTPFNDTWTWDGRGKTWTEHFPVLSPSARSYAAMAPDPVTGTVVLFGGSAIGTPTEFLGDTWTWDGTAKTWTLQTPAVSPPPRINATMAYDKKRRQVVLFGGQDNNSSLLSDTWTWDGATGTWTQHTPPTSPPGRYLASMAYDAFRQRVVLFGGDDGVRDYPTPRGTMTSATNDTWTWDGTSWTQQTPLAPPEPRTNAAMAYHPGTQRTVLFSGFTGDWFPPEETRAFSDTWTYGGEWKRRL